LSFQTHSCHSGLIALVGGPRVVARGDSTGIYKSKGF